MPRPVILAGLLGAAVGVPYVVEHADQWQSKLPTTNSAAASPGQPATAPASSIPTIPIPAGPGDHLYGSQVPLEGIPTYSVADVLRMDVSKEWVYSRWARKSTGLAEPDLYGVRVALVSGTRMTDIAGSLTYYFNAAGQVDKIRLTGNTADTRELVRLLTQRFGFRPAMPLVAGEQAFRVEADGQVQSELTTRPASVLWTTSPHNSFAIELEMNRPGSGRYVKRPLPKLQAIDTPSTPPLLPGQQPPRPPGQPVLPGEVIVPSADNVPAQQASTKKEAPDEPPVKKVPKPPLRWPN